MSRHRLKRLAKRYFWRFIGVLIPLLLIVLALIALSGC